MINNSKIESRLNLLRELSSGTGKLSGTKTIIISVFDVSTAS